MRADVLEVVSPENPSIFGSFVAPFLCVCVSLKKPSNPLDLHVRMILNGFKKSVRMKFKHCTKVENTWEVPMKAAYVPKK